GIWVTHGCRGEFLVEGSEGRREGEGEGREGRRDEYDRDRDRDRSDWKRDPQHFRIVTCESKDNRRNLCRTETRFGVDIRKQLSISECRFRDTWGYDVDGIWVKDGCRAEFFVRVP
ncbi:MAG TPA: DUF3011 domain-containing protein, partial [Thermoanaerobaculia bacterium]|nr:DUF3011 domain-containing protein [Thermoanaerobaculia bacterium]